MPFSNLANSESNASWVVKNMMIPGGALVVILTAGTLFTSRTGVIPMLNTAVLGLLALYLRPQTMVFWACCFTASTIFALYNLGPLQAVSLNLALTRETRSLGVVIGAVIVMLLCDNRNKVARSSAQLSTLLRQLPLPFVLSDQNGTLLFASALAARMMQMPQEQFAGRDYFSLLMKADGKGATIQQYLRALESVKHDPSMIELNLPGYNQSEARGLLIPVNISRSKILMTIISRQSSDDVALQEAGRTKS